MKNNIPVRGHVDKRGAHLGEDYWMKFGFVRTHISLVCSGFIMSAIDEDGYIVVGIDTKDLTVEKVYGRILERSEELPTLAGGLT